MVSVSFFERLKTIGNLIISQSFFLTIFVVLILTLLVLLINVKVKSKAPRYAAAIVYFGLAVLVLARYGHYVLTLNDSIVEKFFKAMYFPNIVVYLSMLIISILLMIANIIDERFSVFAKIINSVSFFLIWFLFILTVDSVKRAGLNFYEVKELYSNKTVMILLQASMGIFAIWIGVVITDLIVRKVADKMDNMSKIKDIDIDSASNFKFDSNSSDGSSVSNMNSISNVSLNSNSNINANLGIDSASNFKFNSNSSDGSSVNFDNSIDNLLSNQSVSEVVDNKNNDEYL